MDNLPNTVMEAMALGKIVISSDATSGEQLITDSENGFLTKVDDKEDLYRKICMAMSLPKQSRQQIEHKAKERVLELRPEVV